MAAWNSELALRELRRDLSLFIRDTAQVYPISGYIDDVFELNAGDFRRLVATHLLLAPQTQKAIDTAGELLRTLPSSVGRADEEMRGHIRGQVDWSRTTQRRYSTGDKTLFVCRPPEKRYDTPLAQLISMTLRECASIADAAPFPRIKKSRPGLNSRIQRLGGEARLLLRSPKLVHFGHLSRLMPPQRIIDAVIRRRPAAVELVDFLKRVRKAFHEHDSDVVSEVLGEHLLAEDKGEKIFELQVGFGIAHHLRARGFNPQSKSLIGDSRAPLFEGRHNDGRTAIVRWQRHTWTVFPPRPTDAIYIATRIAAGMKHRRGYRPDVIVTIDNPQRILLVEAKLTEGEGAASESDGITEMLAYLFDAESILEGVEPPHGLVVAWNSTGTPARSKVMISDQDHIGHAIDILLDVPHQ